MRRMIPQKEIEKLEPIQVAATEYPTDYKDGGIVVGDSEIGAVVLGTEATNECAFVGSTQGKLILSNRDTDGNTDNFIALDSDGIGLYGTVKLDASDSSQLVIGQNSEVDYTVSLGNFDGDPAWYTNGGIVVGDGTASLRMYDSGTGKETKLEVSNGQIVISNIPTADPHVAGALWNDSGTLKVSAGA